MNDELHRTLGHGLAVAVLAPVWRHRLRAARIGAGRGAGTAAAALSLAGPAALVTSRLAGRRYRVCRPASATGSALLLLHVALAATAEELLWRAPAAAIVSRRRRMAIAGASTVGFVLAHRPADSSEAMCHAANATAWTLSAFVGRRIDWSLVAHTAYNLVAVSVRPAAAAAGTR